MYFFYSVPRILEVVESIAERSAFMLTSPDI